MKLSDVKEMIRTRSGYRVSFEMRDNGLLKSNHTPDQNEVPFATEEEAWDFARKLSVVPDVVNIYVVWAGDWTPVSDYGAKMLNKHD